MSRPFPARRRSWKIYVLLAAAALIAAVAAGLAVQTALGHHHRENFRLPAVPPLPGAASPPPSASGTPRLAGPLLSVGGVPRGLRSG